MIGRRSALVPFHVMPVALPMSPAKRSRLPIEVRESTVHGSGAFAARSLAAGERIGRYTGKLYSPAEVTERNWDTTLTFVFGLSDGCVIDGARGGNATRHINHSCSPNCAAFEIETPSGELRIVIEALQPIEAGEELFLDYSLDPGGDSPEDFACHCGSSQCRGTLVSLEASQRAR